MCAEITDTLTTSLALLSLFVDQGGKFTPDLEMREMHVLYGDKRAVNIIQSSVDFTTQHKHRHSQGKKTTHPKRWPSAHLSIRHAYTVCGSEVTRKFTLLTAVEGRVVEEGAGRTAPLNSIIFLRLRHHPHVHTALLF